MGLYSFQAHFGIGKYLRGEAVQNLPAAPEDAASSVGSGIADGKFPGASTLSCKASPYWVDLNTQIRIIILVRKPCSRGYLNTIG